MDPRSYVLYTVYRQLDALADDAKHRVLSGFASIEAEAEEYAEAAFRSYGQLSGEGDLGDFAESARDQGIEYYQVLSDLRQAMINLIAVGLYHLFENHKSAVNFMQRERGLSEIKFSVLSSWSRVEELRLLANAVKHADGDSAQRLRTLRPDYFVRPELHGSVLHEHLVTRPRPLLNPLGGTDLFVRVDDIDNYRDALRALWEEAMPEL